jgi:hypothetical protein
MLSEIVSTMTMDPEVKIICSRSGGCTFSRTFPEPILTCTLYLDHCLKPDLAIAWSAISVCGMTSSVLPLAQAILVCVLSIQNGAADKLKDVLYIDLSRSGRQLPSGCTASI